MSKGIGRQLGFGIGKETTRGTSVAPSYWIPFAELAIDEKFENAIDQASVGVIEDSVSATRVKEWAEGTMKAPIGDAHFPLMLLAALGSISSAVKETTAYNHTITVQQGVQHQSLTLGIDDPLGGQDYRHALGVITSLEITYEQGKLLEYSVGFKAKKGATATNTPSYTAENRFTHKHFVFKIATTQSGLDAAGVQNVRSATLKIEKNVEDDPILGSIAPNDFMNKQFAIEGTIEAIWQNETDFKTFVLAGTAKALRFDLTNTDVTIGASSNPRVKIDLHSAVFKEISRPVRINDVVVQTLAFKAHYSLIDAKMVSVLCNNTVTAY